MTNWQTKKLEDLTIKGGLVRGPFGGALKKEIFKSSGFKVYEQRNAIHGTIELGDYYIDENKFQKLKRFSVNEGDFIVSCSGTIGRIFKIPEGAPRGVINQALLKITIDKDVVLPEYFHQYFKWDRFQSEVIDNTQGGAMQNLVGMDIFRSTKLQIPETPEQERIVGVLGVWDEYIEKLEQKIALKEQLKKGLMQQLLTGRRRLSGFSDEWQNARLGDIAKMQSGGTPSSKNDEFYGKDIIWVSIADMTSSGKYISDSQKKLSKLGYESSTARLYPANTVLYAMYASIGECVIASVPLSSSQAILGIQPSDKLDNEFLYYYLTSKKDAVKLLGQQGTQSNLNAGIVKDFEINLPTVEEQRAVSAALSRSDDEINLLKDNLSIVELQKKYLLKNLITGTIRTQESLVIKGGK